MWFKKDGHCVYVYTASTFQLNRLSSSSAVSAGAPFQWHRHRKRISNQTQIQIETVRICSFRHLNSFQKCITGHRMQLVAFPHLICTKIAEIENQISSLKIYRSHRFDYIFLKQQVHLATCHNADKQREERSTHTECGASSNILKSKIAFTLPPLDIPNLGVCTNRKCYYNWFSL